MGTPVEHKEREKAMMKALAEIQASGKNMLEVLNIVVDEDWTTFYDPLDGDIYRCRAFGILQTPSANDFSFYSLVRGNGWPRISKMFGAILICLIQILGPPITLWSLVMVKGEFSIGLGQWFQSLEVFRTKLLALLLSSLLTIHCSFRVDAEAISWLKAKQVFDYLNCSERSNMHGWVLLLGACTNCYVYVGCCCCTLVALGQTESPKDVLFDAVAIIFLFKLDDLTSDLGLISLEDWPGKKLAWVQAQMMKQAIVVDGGVGHHVFRTTRVILIVMTITFPIIFIFTNMREAKA